MLLQGRVVLVVLYAHFGIIPYLRGLGKEANLCNNEDITRMKWYLSQALLILVGIFFAFPSSASANSVVVSENDANSETHVSVETNTGNNTICVNGECKTTDSGSGESTVCINGNCTTSSDPTIHKESADGKSVVDITNETKEKAKTLTDEEKKKITERSAKEIEEKKKLIEAEKEALKKKVEEKENMIQQILEQIQSMFQGFSFFTKE